MILSGEKREEYRELKKYWVSRIFKADFGAFPLSEAVNYMNATFRHIYVLRRGATATPCITSIQFTNGYSKNSPTFQIECKGISIGKGNPEWGGTDKDVFILSLGKIIKQTI